MKKLLLLLPLCAISSVHQPALANQLGVDMALEVEEHRKSASRFLEMGQKGLACDEVHSANAVLNVWFNEIKKVTTNPSDAFDWRIRVRAAANECIRTGHMP